MSLPRTVSSRGDWRTFLLYLATFAGIVIAANVWVAQRKWPDYGTWTGSQPIERKLQLLEQFASRGPVDILVFSSSVGDHGVSAETLSGQLTALRGRPVRVFNFSTGGAGLPCYPLLYRLARTIVIPREILAVIPPDVASAPLAFDMSKPENVLRHAPVGEVIDTPWELAIAHRFWGIPIVRNASALRDYALYGRYENRVKTNLDLYAISGFGDTVNYTLIRSDAVIREFNEARVQLLGGVWTKEQSEPDEKARLALYLAEPQIAAARELQKLAKADGAGIRVLADDAAVSLAIDDESYRAARRSYYKHLIEATGLPVVNFIDRYRVRRYEAGDPQHMNMEGARRFSSAAAVELSGRPFRDDNPAPPFPDLAQIAASDTSFGVWTAVLAGEASKPPKTLEVTVVQTWQTPTMSPGELIEVILRTPENTDVTLPAAVVRRGVAVCDVSSLPRSDRIYFARIASMNTHEALNYPVERFRWLSKPYAQAAVRADEAELAILTRSVAAGGVVRVQWKKLPHSKPADWIGVYPKDAPNSARLDFKFTGGGESGKLDIPIIASFKPGEYELRLFWDHGAQAATSPAFTVSGSTTTTAGSSPSAAATVPVSQPSVSGTISVNRASVPVAGEIKVQWTISSPDRQDWAGIFPVGEPESARLTFRFLNGAAAGVLDLLVPANSRPGRYELRLFSKGGWQRVAVSKPFSITLCQATVLVANDAGVYAGGKLKARWSGIDSPDKQDWIGLFPAGQPDTTRTVWTFVNGAPSGVVEIPVPDELPDGRYELRLFAKGGWQRLATSTPFPVKGVRQGRK